MIGRPCDLSRPLNNHLALVPFAPTAAARSSFASPFIVHPERHRRLRSPAHPEAAGRHLRVRAGGARTHHSNTTKVQRIHHPQPDEAIGRRGADDILATSCHAAFVRSPEEKALGPS